MNFKTLNEAKAGFLTTLGTSVNSWLSKFIGNGSDAYNIDLSNFKSLAEAKAAILNALNSEIKKINANMASTIEEYNKLVNQTLANKGNSDIDGVSGMGSQNSASGNLTNKLNGYKNQLNQINNAIKEVNTNFDQFGAGFSQYSPSSFGGNTFGGSGGGTGGGSNSSSQAEKDWKDSAKLVSDMTDKYYDLNNAIEDYNELLSMNKAKQELATGEEKIKLMNEEIRLIETKKQAIQNLINEQIKERDGIKNAAWLHELKYDADGDITNRNYILNNKKEYANNLDNFASEEARQNYLDYIDAMEEAIKRYEELNKVIPENKLELEGLNATIKDIYETQLDLIGSEEERISKLIEHEAKKRYGEKKKANEKEMELEEERLNKLKESLQKEKVNDASYVQKCA